MFEFGRRRAISDVAAVTWHDRISSHDRVVRALHTCSQQGLAAQLVNRLLVSLSYFSHYFSHAD